MAASAGGAKHTEFAMQALGFAELFRAQFSGQRLEGGGKAFTVQITEPEGPSTGGGKQAVQHVKLVPDKGGPAIVVASANSAAKTAEIRSHVALSAGYAQRFKGQPFPIPSAQYQELTGRLSYFFDMQGLAVTLSEEAPQLAGGAAPSGGASSNTALIAIIVVAAVVLLGGALVLLK